MKQEIIGKLIDFIDELETEYGELEGFEVKLEHPIDDDIKDKQGFATIKEFVIYYLQKEKIEL